MKINLKFGRFLPGIAAFGWMFCCTAPIEAQTTGDKKNRVDVSNSLTRAQYAEPRSMKKTKKSNPPQKPWLRWKLDGGWSLRVPIVLQFSTGYTNNYRYRDFEGGAFEIDTKIVPTLVNRNLRFVLRLPLDYKRYETAGYHLPVQDLHAGLHLEFRLTDKLKFGARSFFKRILREGWPDYYQPILDGAGAPSGEYHPTDRYSYLSYGGKGFLRWRIGKRVYLKGFAGALYRNYTDDTNYDGTDDPTHLVPGDQTRLLFGLHLGGKTWKKKFRYYLDLRGEWIEYHNAYSRDAGTGKTHSPPGGLPPNPLQQFVRVRLKEYNKLSIRKIGLTLTGFVEYNRNEDLFQGYYTWNELGVGLRLDQRIFGRLSAGTGFQVSYRRYTSNGYQQGQDHPELDDGGDIRTSLLYKVVSRISYRWWNQRLDTFIDVSWISYSTNFPDYVPGINPASRAYDINWDYINLALFAGVQLKF